MSKNHFVVYYNLEWHTLIEDKNKLEYNKFNISTVEDLDQIISFQTSDLIREYNRKVKHIPQIIDLESLDIQMSQKGRDMRFGGKWSIIQRLLEFGIISSYNEIGDNIPLFLKHINTFYKRLIAGAPEEFERFQNIEKEIGRIIYKAQARGICVNKQEIAQKCCELEKHIYKIKNKFQLEYSIFTPDRKETQITWLNKNEYKVYNSIEETFKANKTNEVCGDFYELIRSIKDYNCYLYMLSQWGGEDRIHPMYIGFGTVTSRITMRQPSIQNLRKQNRDIIKADVGKVLIYVDFSQFEAGILASLSKDDKLSDLYKSDIYEDLAEYVYNDKKKRKDSKILFYRYMYGDESLNEKTKQYFNRFENIGTYIKSINKEIEENGKIGSPMGNYRIVPEKEKTSWALSHKIQSTASFIFKNALIRVDNELKDAELLVPLHDAALYQIPKEKYQEYKLTLPRLFEEEFRIICPQINPRASICNFCK